MSGLLAHRALLLGGGGGGGSGLSFIGSAQGNDSASLPAGWAAGDIAIVYSFRNGSSSPPDLGTGYTNIDTGSDSVCAGRIAYRVLQSGDASVPTFASSTILLVSVFRGQAASPIGGFAPATSDNAGPVLTYPAITMSSGGGSSWVIGCAGIRDSSTNIEDPPTGMINRQSRINGANEAAIHDTNGGVSSWTAQTVTLSAGQRIVAFSLELKAA